MQDSFEKWLIEQCAPTLAGIKPGSLFNYKEGPCENVNDVIASWDRILKEKGIRVCLIKEFPNGGLVYVYRPSMLSKLLSDEKISDFLCCTGYSGGDVIGQIEELKHRFNGEGAFPHEIGIFLGYPLHDVKGFIENKGANFSLLGMWKVYDNPAVAEKLFEQYRECRNAYSAMYENGKGIYHLTVSA